jgi:two-component system alkaline phosphatase synthesis response regulator PhoP
MDMDKKILIVDDEPFIRTLLEQALEDFEDKGVILLTAGDGEEALRLAQTERPDLVLLDVMMPCLSGYEVCRQIKTDAELNGIYVILLTARGQEGDRLRGEDVGADEYLTKPFDPDEIIGRAQEILNVAV